MRDISARELKRTQHSLAVERFQDSTRWMVEFSWFASARCPYGSPGDEVAAVSHGGRVSGRPWTAQQQPGDQDQAVCPRFVEGHVLDFKPDKKHAVATRNPASSLRKERNEL